jgi:hypothetical protein
VNPNQTIIDYEGQAMIGGALARLNTRFIEGVAKTLIDQGLAKLNQQVQAEAAVNPWPEKVAQDSFFIRLVGKFRRLFQPSKAS